MVPGRALVAPTSLALGTGQEHSALLFSAQKEERDLRAVPDFVASRLLRGGCAALTVSSFSAADGLSSLFPTTGQPLGKHQRL